MEQSDLDKVYRELHHRRDMLQMCLPGDTREVLLKEMNSLIYFVEKLAQEKTNPR